MKLTEPRKVCAYLCRKHTGLSCKELGTLFNRDFSTIIYFQKDIEFRLSSNSYFKNIICQLEQLLS